MPLASGGLRQGTCRSDEERQVQIATLEESGFSRKEILALVRDTLTVLNAKAATLLTFNAIALASLSIWASNTPVVAGSPLASFHVALDCVYLLLLVSGLLSLFNVSIRWYFDAPLSDSQLVSYLQERDRRTKLHRAALAIASSGLPALVAASLLYLTSVASFVFGLCEEPTAFWCALAPIDHR